MPCQHMRDPMAQDNGKLVSIPLDEVQETCILVSFAARYLSRSRLQGAAGTNSIANMTGSFPVL